MTSPEGKSHERTNDYYFDYKLPKDKNNEPIYSFAWDSPNALKFRKHFKDIDNGTIKQKLVFDTNASKVLPLFFIPSVLFRGLHLFENADSSVEPRGQDYLIHMSVGVRTTGHNCLFRLIELLSIEC